MAATLLCGMAACQDKEAVIFDNNADAPEIISSEVDKAEAVYGDSVEFHVISRDADCLSHISVEVQANGQTILSQTYPSQYAAEMEVKGKFAVPFGANCPDATAVIKVEAVNHSARRATSENVITVKRPQFDRLYLVTSEGETVLEKPAGGGNPNLYEATVDMANGTEGFIYSETGRKGYKWGFDEGSNTASLTSDTPIPFSDSESDDEKVTRVTFDMLSFAVGPLKKEMAINGVPFSKFRRNPSDDSFVNNALCASGVPLKKGEALQSMLLDMSQVTFDPDFFTVKDGQVIYTGDDCTANLYLNQLFNFMFIESPANPLVLNAGYPDVLICNGWGIGWPELWGYNPGWDFGSAVTFRKVSESDTDTVYAQTVVVSKWANFKFYTKTDWDGEFSCPDIEFVNGDFTAHEEDGKPGNYNIYTVGEDATAWKSAVVRIRFTVPKSGNKTKFESKILVTSDQD